MAEAHDTRHIVQSLIGNLLIASAKGVAAFFSGSGAMLAEALHSAADCANQMLLLIGVHRARRPADASHPLGYGREAYFWSFIVALLLFSGGGVFSIYEGVHKLQHPEPIQRVMMALIILGLALAIEGAATLSNIREINRRRGTTPLFRYLRQTKEVDLVVVFGENSAATLGLLVASGALVLAQVTGDARYDALGSIVVGGVLVAVAAFLGVEVKSLLVGESADPEIAAAATALLPRHPCFATLLQIVTVQQGPGDVMVAIKARLSPGLNGDGIGEAINAFEVDLRKRCPAVRWCFVEPDVREKRLEPPAS